MEREFQFEDDVRSPKTGIGCYLKKEEPAIHREKTNTKVEVDKRFLKQSRRISQAKDKCAGERRHRYTLKDPEKKDKTPRVFDKL